MLTRATLDDLKEIDELALLVIHDMMLFGIPQWDESYPRQEHYKLDIENNALFLYKDKDAILGAITLLAENDLPYKTINSWVKEKSIVIHRMLVHPKVRNKGIAKSLLEYAIHFSKLGAYESIKIDTHLENYKMRNFLKKNGFIELEYLKTIDRLAYELVLEEKI